MSNRTNIYGEPLPEHLRDVEDRHLSGDGPPHPDPKVERSILRWALGYHATERDPWGGP